MTADLVVVVNPGLAALATRRPHTRGLHALAVGNLTAAVVAWVAGSVPLAVANVAAAMTVAAIADHRTNA